MKNRFLTFAIVALFGFLVGCQDAAEKKQTNAALSVMHPDARMGLWVVTLLSEPPGDRHIDVGDSFRINKTGGSYKLVPLYLLRERWLKGKDFVVDLEENGDLLCGKVELTSHSKDVDQHTDHLFKFRMADDELEILTEVWTDGMTLIAQCVASSPIHGGIAHAEN